MNRKKKDPQIWTVVNTEPTSGGIYQQGSDFLIQNGTDMTAKRIDQMLQVVRDEYVATGWNGPSGKFCGKPWQAGNSHDIKPDGDLQC